MDKKNKSNYNDDPELWPVFFTDIDAIPSILDEADFGVIETSHLSSLRQITGLSW